MLHQQTVDKHLVLPEKPFHCGRILTVKADKCGLIHFETHIPGFAQKKVLIEVLYNEIRILDNDYQCIVRHPRLYGNQTMTTLFKIISTTAKSH